MSAEFGTPVHSPTASVATMSEGESGFRTAVKDIVFGSTAGMIGKFFEFPFDTVKVRLQSQPDTLPLRYTGPVDCFMQGLRAHGFRGLYHGISSPLVGAAAENSSLFFSYTISQNVYRRLAYSDGYKEKLPLGALVFCGATSGAFTSVILTPIELIKCKMQVQTIPVFAAPGSVAPVGVKHPGPIALVREIYKAHGMHGFWHGQMGTFFRETGGSAAWFGSYEYVSATLMKFRKTEKNSAVDQMIAGAVAGVSYNFILFPADSIKSRMQTMAIGHSAAQSESFWAVGKGMYKAGGIKALYRGCGITCARSAPSSAIIFLCYETLKSWF